MKKPILTKENYYDDNFYMSTSRFKNYIMCESRAVAIDNGAWEDKSKPIALTVGSYIHSYFEGFEAHETFVQQYEKRIFKSNGDKCADFIQADLANGKQIFESHVERVKQVLLGIAAPKKCGICNWCRHTKEITRPVTLSEIVTGDE